MTRPRVLPCTEFQQPLPIFIHLSNDKMSDADGPTVIVRSQSSIDITKNGQLFSGQHISHGRVEIPIEWVLFL